MPPRLAFVIAVVWLGSGTALGVGSAWLLRRGTGRRWMWWSVLVAVPFWMLVGVGAVLMLRWLLGKW